jgi:hypothetical protein
VCAVRVTTAAYQSTTQNTLENLRSQGQGCGPQATKTTSSTQPEPTDVHRVTSICPVERAQSGFESRPRHEILGPAAARVRAWQPTTPGNPQVSFVCSLTGPLRAWVAWPGLSLFPHSEHFLLTTGVGEPLTNVSARARMLRTLTGRGVSVGSHDEPSMAFPDRLTRVTHNDAWYKRVGSPCTSAAFLRHAGRRRVSS